MAGNYPDVPEHRIAYDLDGTQLFFNGGQLTLGYLQSANNEADDVIVGGYGNGSYLFMFPFTLDVRGILARGWGQVNPYGSVQYSTNTTNGQDGTFVGTSGYSAAGGMGGAAHREQISAVNLTGVRAIYVHVNAAGGQAGCYGLHVYGGYNVSADLNRLEFWHPTIAERAQAAYFDYGNVPRATTVTKQFRIKNMSPSLTANTITVTFDALTDTSPGTTTTYYVSTDGINFYGSRVLASLAPGALSPVMWVRRVTPSNAVIGVWDNRMKATVTSWT